jgi:hypothetical protein
VVAEDPIIAPSALKHGLSEEEVLHAYRNPVRVWDLGDGFTMIVGPNAAAIFLEVGYVDGDTAVVIVHAMRPREVPEVMTMPRSVEEILQHADELAERFENYEPNSADEIDTGAVALLRAAIQERSQAERHLIDAIRAARESGMSWSAIGTFVGTSGEAARQKYSGRVA